MKILIALYHSFSLWNAPPWLGARLQTDFPQYSVVHLLNYDGVSEAIQDADVLISWSIRPEQFAHAQRLQWIHSPAAAVHQLMFPQMVKSKVIVTNAREVHGPVVAEHILALIFAMAKRLPDAMRSQQKAVWAQQAIWESKPTVRELNGSTVCVIGMGSIGTGFTRRARALGMRVLAVREHPERGDGGADSVFASHQLAEVLPQSDFVVLAAPLTSSTKAIINAHTLALMKKDAYLINVGRGPLIDDASLIVALQQKRIAGAALDVFAEEPLPQSSPYWSLENVLVTPHIAAVTEHLWERHYELITDNLRSFAAKQPLRGVVDKDSGY